MNRTLVTEVQAPRTATVLEQQTFLEPKPGIEPGSAAYQAAILPLNYKGSSCEKHGAGTEIRTPIYRLRGECSSH